MLEEYIYRGSEKLRCGYTTGSCAAAAAKAAAEMLITGEIVCHAEIMTPKGIPLELQVLNAEKEKDYAVCGIKKVYAELEENKEEK